MFTNRLRGRVCNRQGEAGAKGAVLSQRKTPVGRYRGGAPISQGIDEPNVYRTMFSSSFIWVEKKG